MQGARDAVNDSDTASRIVLDLGGTWSRVALWEGGRLGEVTRLETPRENVVDVLAGVVQGLGGNPRRAGVSATGPVDPVTGRLGDVPNAPWLSGLDLREGLRRALGVDVVVERDTNAALLAEHAFGAARGCRDAVYLTLSTGVGGAVLADGRLLRGSRGVAGEIGHMVVREDGPLCGCGRRGCLEAMSSGDGLSRRATSYAEGHPDSVLGQRLRETLAHGGTALTGRDVATAALGIPADEHAQRLLDEARSAFTTAVVDVVNAWDPERVVVGGSIARAFPAWLGEAGRAVREECLVPPRGGVVVPAALGEDAELLGAAVVAAGPPLPTNP